MRVVCPNLVVKLIFEIFKKFLVFFVIVNLILEVNVGIWILIFSKFNFVPFYCLYPLPFKSLGIFMKPLHSYLHQVLICYLTNYHDPPPKNRDFTST